MSEEEEKQDLEIYLETFKSKEERLAEVEQREREEQRQRLLQEDLQDDLLAFRDGGQPRVENTIYSIIEDTVAENMKDEALLPEELDLVLEKVA